MAALQSRMCTCAVLALGVTGMLSSGSYAASLIPEKAYVKLDEPMLVHFYDETPDGKKALATVGFAAAKLEGLFKPTENDSYMSSDSKPLFTLYKFDGTKITPSIASKAFTSAGEADLGLLYPEIREGGTFILVWKDATPLVIETLYNPGQSKADLERMKDQMAQMPEAQKKQVMDHFAPTVTHIEPLVYAEIKTDKGNLQAKFAYDVAPHTVDNFLTLARQGYYDGTVFHRIISGFMIQGGDSTGSIDGRAGTGGPGYQIMQEFSDKKHLRGTLSMARAEDPNSAGSQFFIMHGDTPSLDGQYTAFGDITDGMPVVDMIAKTPVADGNGTVNGVKPKLDSVRILPATAAMYGIK